MFERPWSGPYAFVAVGAVLLGLLLYVTWHASAQRQFYADQAYYQAQRAADRADAELEDCFARAAVSIPKCVERVVEAEREAQRAEYDLAAQQEMAYWTPWILLSSVVAAVAASIGVVYLAISNRIIWRGYTQSQRPWVSIAPTISSDLVFKDLEGRITISCKARNHGNAPAVGLYVSVTIAAEYFMGVTELAEMHKSEEQRKGKLGHHLFPGEEFTFEISAPIERKGILAWAEKTDGWHEMIAPAVVICAGYWSPIDDNEVLLTDRILALMRKAPLGGMIPTQDGVIPASDLTLTFTFGSGGAR